MYCYTRTLNDEKWLVVCNMTKAEQEISLSECAPVRKIISNYDKKYESLDEIHLAPFEAFVVEVK
ncbi:alpha-glucosidase C-terminal domain-containing protein [Vagococcus elongatus]|uniref:alpha-glucosidase C-terminal domain-containing protein n=1 Tax=Vagococcus elongatus TaxID=180344 RepID=UPI0014777F9A|nr:alpha-glucosidase C-terminal domain-containing protein [Vagococcus elongatus]